LVASAVAAAGPAQSTGMGFELTLTSPKLVEVEPGRIVTASYLVANHTAETVDLIEQLDPDLRARGWQPVISYERPIRLEAGGQSVQLVTFIVPRSCPAGTYDIGYTIFAGAPPRAVATEAFSVVIKPVMKLDAVVENKPGVVVAGNEYRVDLVVTNAGNSAVRMKATAKGSPDFPTVVDPADARLEAGGSHPLSVLVKTDPSIRTRTNQVLEVKVLADAPECGSTSLSRTIFVEILPPLLAEADLRHSVPSEISFIAVGQNDESGTQLEYTGSGTLDEAGSRRIDFRFRGPDVMDRSVYGTRDALSFDYSDPAVSILLGDRLYSLSPLSELLTYARGGEIRVRPGAFEIGSSYSETRWDAPRETEAGAFAAYRYGSLLGLRANYLNKRADQNSSFPGYRADIYTLQSRIHPGTALDLGFEYARSEDAAPESAAANAFRGTLDGSLSKRLWYTFEHTYAAPEFLGYYRDVIYSNGTIAFDLASNLRSHLSYRLSRRNLDLDPARNAGTRDLSYIGGVSYTFPTGTNASIEYESLDRKDELDPTRLDFIRGTVRLGLGHTFRTIGVQGYAEEPSIRNRIPGAPSRTFENYSFYTYYRPSPSQSYTLFTRYGHNSFTGDPERTMNIGAAAWIQLRSRLRMNLSYQKNNIDSERLPLQDYLFTSIDLTLPWKHSISLTGRWFKFENVAKEDYAFFAAYTVPLSVPAMKKRSFGSLRGTIYDRGRCVPTPVPNVLVSVGDLATLSNERGEFSFPVLSPGAHQLTVDQRSMGMNRIVTDGLPVSVEIAGGEAAVRDIGLAEACDLSGRVAVFELPADSNASGRSSVPPSELYVAGTGSIRRGPVGSDELVEAGGLEQIAVVISNGTERLHQRTDENGRFSFKGLRPGVWRIDVDANQLPPQHYMESTAFEMELASGAERELIVKVLPRLRSVRLLPGGTITATAQERNGR
jgi:hypothetical protein